MEHQAFVPFPVETVRRALRDPERVARCVPGLQRDVDPVAGAPGVLAGRLRVRIAGSSITYRGRLRLTPRADGGLDADGEGAEARGAGSVKLVLSAVAADAPPEEGIEGTRLAFTVTLWTQGRLADIDAAAAAAAGHRLLDRFAASLADDLSDESAARRPDEDLEPEGPDEAEPEEPRAGEPEEAREPDEAREPEEVRDAGRGAAEAEAAHARRTMIGRSAEEVDHAPPRGRYAPVPAPETVSVGDSMRWMAPAAAALIASAIVIGRALRRRRAMPGRS